MFISSSETHNKKNMNQSIHETLPVIKQMTADLKAAGKTRARIFPLCLAARMKNKCQWIKSSG